MSKKTAEELRKQARKLLSEADRIEDGRAVKIGKLVLKHERAGFAGFDLETFKNEIAKL